jgi:two-component system, NarL family, nitrate/nitrite response regulator NarL
MNTPQSKPIRVALISNLQIVSWGLEKLVQNASPRLEFVGSFSDCAEVAQTFDLPVDVILLDLDGSKGSESIETLCSLTSAKLLALTGADNAVQRDSAVVAGAHGVVSMRESPETLVKAIEKVHEGELWVDRASTGRIFDQLSQKTRQPFKTPDQKKIDTLTKRELQTISEITMDASATGKVIAQRLNISENTLRNHLNSIYAKLGLSSRLELFLYAKRHTISDNA